MHLATMALRLSFVVACVLSCVGNAWNVEALERRMDEVGGINERTAVSPFESRTKFVFERDYEGISVHPPINDDIPSPPEFFVASDYEGISVHPPINDDIPSPPEFFVASDYEGISVHPPINDDIPSPPEFFGASDQDRRKPNDEDQTYIPVNTYASGIKLTHAHRKMLAASNVHYPPLGLSNSGSDDPTARLPTMLLEENNAILSNTPKDQTPAASSRLLVSSTEGTQLNMTAPDDPFIGSVSIVNKLPTLMHAHCRNADDSIDLTYLTVQKDATYHFDVQQNMTGPTIYWCFFQYAGSSNFHQQFNVWTDGPVFENVKCTDCIWSVQMSGLFIYDDQTPGDALVNAYQWLAW